MRHTLIVFPTWKKTIDFEPYKARKKTHVYCFIVIELLLPHQFDSKVSKQISLGITMIILLIFLLANCG